MTVKLTTLSRVQQIIKGTLSSAEQDFIDDLIDGLTPVAEKFLNRKLELTEYTEQFDIRPGQRTVFLNAYPVASSPAAEFRSDISRDFTGDAIDADNYYFDLDRGIVQFDRAYLGYGPGVFQGIWTGGMASSTAVLVSSAAFEGIVLGADLQVSHMFQRRHEIGLTNFSAEGGSIALSRAAGRLCEPTIDLWTPYKRVGRRRP